MPRSFFQKFNILLLILFLLGASRALGQSVEELKVRIQEKEREIQALEEKADEYRKSVEESLKKARTLQGEIARIDTSLKQLAVNLQITAKKIETKELEIQQIGKDIKKTTEDIEKRRGEIGEVLRTIHALDQESLLASMVRNDRLTEFLEEYAYLEGLERGLQGKVLALRQEKTLLEEDLEASKNARRELQSLSASLQNQKKIVENKKGERQTLLRETKNQEKNFQRLLTETIQKQEEIQREIFEMESELRRKIVSANLPPRQAGLFVWPVDNGYVTQEFGTVSSASITRDFYRFHNGIDFGAKTGIGTPVRAVLDGEVTATGSNGRYAYGRWIAIRHPNNLTTLYAHLSLVGVSVGQRVLKGQVIGYMGQTGLATGPHLHLTVYASETFRVENRWFGLLPLGGAINPRDYF